MVSIAASSRCATSRLVASSVRAAGGGGVKLRGEARTVGAKRVQLGVQRLLAAVCFVPTPDRGRQRVERKRKTSAGRVNRAGLAHSRPLIGQYPPDSSALWPRKSFGSASG